MIPPAFDYHRPDTVAEALDLLSATAGADTAVLAGGHSLLPDMKAGEAAPEVVVDVSEVEALSGVDAGETETVVGATTTYETVADSDHLRRVATALADAAAAVGDVQVRHRGTVGGNLVYADPAADLPAAAIATDATLQVRGPDRDRTVDAAAFLVDGAGDALGPAELVTGVRVPHAPDRGGAYAKKTHPASGFALVGVAARVAVDGDEVTDARVGATGATDHAVRLQAVEEELVGSPATPEAPAEAADRAAEGLDDAVLRSDAHASGEFRAKLLAVYAERALSTALDRANSGGKPR